VNEMSCQEVTQRRPYAESEDSTFFFGWRSLEACMAGGIGSPNLLSYKKTP